MYARERRTAFFSAAGPSDCFSRQSMDNEARDKFVRPDFGEPTAKPKARVEQCRERAEGE